MKNIIKYILLGWNVITFSAIFYWYKYDAGFEPIVVGITQIGSVLTVLFEKQISGGSTTISGITGSKIDATVTGEGHTLDINDVKKGSKVKYKKD